MQNLILSAKRLAEQTDALPFSVYTSTSEQRILNVPVLKPLLICVLHGRKILGSQNRINCPAGTFVFLPNAPSLDMRNIPADTEYSALLIEFDFEDFESFTPPPQSRRTFIQGPIDSVLQNTVQQFVEWSGFAPAEMWPTRRREILYLLDHLGHGPMGAMIEQPSLSHRLHGMISADVSNDLHARILASRLAMSESTLRRRLSAEGTSLQAIKDRARLCHGLHLIQTTPDPISRIAERCGYHSQSRFTDRFKQLFRTTPTELRRTRLRDPGE